MYFIEYILKKIFDRKKKNIEPDYTPSVGIFDEETQNSIDDFNQCKQNFKPVDSTGETFACTNCGFLIKKEDLGKYMKNPFTEKGFL